MWSNTQKTIRLNAQYDPNIAEDRRFAEATPLATVEMTVSNPAALAQLKNGQKFYVDFTPVED